MGASCFGYQQEDEIQSRNAAMSLKACQMLKLKQGFTTLESYHGSNHLSSISTSYPDAIEQNHGKC